MWRIIDPKLVMCSKVCNQITASWKQLYFCLLVCLHHIFLFYARLTAEGVVMSTELRRLPVWEYCMWWLTVNAPAVFGTNSDYIFIVFQSFHQCSHPQTAQVQQNEIRLKTLWLDLVFMLFHALNIILIYAFLEPLQFKYFNMEPCCSITGLSVIGST